jgi:hypothetical protein
MVFGGVSLIVGSPLTSRIFEWGPAFGAGVAGSDNHRAELRGESACCCSVGGGPTELAMTYAEQAGQKFEMPCSLLSAPRTNDCTQNDKHDCHSYQEA